ncbi:MAG: Hsp20 family protein [Hyphomicrobiaceae bacterium]
MRHTDFAPLYRSTVGFDRLFQLLDGATGSDADAPTFPPYDIEKLGDNSYRIVMAVAGFGKDALEVEVKENTLSVKGTKSDENDATEYLHRGIAKRNFERRFQLADHVQVTGADVIDGLLHIDLVRELPERMKPRSVPIGAGKQIEANPVA